MKLTDSDISALICANSLMEGEYLAAEDLVRRTEALVVEKLRREPQVMRYGYDGYGYQYIDNGSGSDWQTRIPDSEPLFSISEENL